MTIDIAAIRQRVEAASPGPWVSTDGDVYAEDTGDLIAEGLDADNPEQSRADAEFAAHARTDVPALLARVDELELAHQLQQRDLLGTIAEIDLLRSALGEIAGMCNCRAAADCPSVIARQALAEQVEVAR